MSSDRGVLELDLSTAELTRAGAGLRLSRLNTHRENCVCAYDFWGAPVKSALQPYS